MNEAYRERPRMKVIDPIGTAVNRAVWMLFPFKFEVWIRIGFISFVGALIGGGCGGSSNFNVPGGGGGGGPGNQNVSDDIEQFREQAIEHLPIIIVVAIAVLVLGFAITLLLNWLGCRGQMMLIRAIAKNDPLIKDNWAATKEIANSAFFFRIFLTLAGFIISIPIIILGGAVILGMAAAGEAAIIPIILALIPFVAILILVSIFVALIDQLLKCFVMPLMYHEGIMCMRGWGRFREVSRGNILPIVGFLIIRLGYFIAYGITSMFVGLFTCCIGFLPVIHQTLFAPFFVFDRAYTLYVLESLGPEWEIIERPDLENPPEPDPPTYQSPPMG